MWVSFECQNAMETTECGPTAEHLLDSVYLRRSENTVNEAVSHLQGTQVSFHSVPSTKY